MCKANSTTHCFVVPALGLDYYPCLCFGHRVEQQNSLFLYLLIFYNFVEIYLSWPAYNPTISFFMGSICFIRGNLRGGSRVFFFRPVNAFFFSPVNASFDQLLFLDFSQSVCNCYCSLYPAGSAKLFPFPSLCTPEADSVCLEGSKHLANIH